MTSLLKRIEKRLDDPKLNANFNREVSKERASLIKFTEDIANEIDANPGDLHAMSDEELARVSDWYFEMSLK